MGGSRIEGLEHAIEVLEEAPQVGKGLFFYPESGLACAAGTLARAAGLDPAQYDYQPSARAVFEAISGAYWLANGEIATLIARNDHGHQGQPLPGEQGRKKEAINYLRALLDEARAQAEGG